MKTPQAQGLAKIFCHLLMFSAVGVNAEYLPGDLNDIADYMSRLFEKDSSPIISHSLIVQTKPVLRDCRPFHISAELHSLLFSALLNKPLVTPTTRVPLGRLSPALKTTLPFAAPMA